VPLLNPVTRLPALRPVPIFRGLTKASLLAVARKAKEVSYPAGSTLVRQGDAGDALCVIVKGSVEVTRDGHVVAVMSAGDFFGEISLIDGEPRSATVAATEDVTLLEVSSDDFRALLADPYVAHAVIRSLAARFRQAQDSQNPHCL
jgi:CRP-like cAMP-binding protein